MIEKIISDVLIEEKIGSELEVIVKNSAYYQYFVLVDENTEKHCLSYIQQTFEKVNKNFQLITIAAGEESKNIESCLFCWSELTKSTADRKAVIINLGGGVVTDLGGFIAATYKRGIDFLNIPTSLLAMVDAAIGGKCGIDFHHFKNQIGVFKDAHRTIIQTDFLKTLPQKEIKSGFAEVIKHALIADQNYFEKLENIENLRDEINKTIVSTSIRIKSEIVKRDPLEIGERKKLNFGHTIGHAIESYYFERNETIPHGYAIGAGMICEAYLSYKKLKLLKEELNLIVALIDKHFDRFLIPKNDISTVLNYITQDKKNIGDKTQFTLLESIGEASINHAIDYEMIKESIFYYCAEE